MKLSCVVSFSLPSALASPMRAIVSLFLFLFASLQAGCATFHQATIRPHLLHGNLARAGSDAFHQGDLKTAEQHFRNALEQFPEDAYCRIRLAETLREQGLLQEAIQELQALIEQQPNEPQHHVELGQLYYQTGQLSPAERQAALAVQLDQRCVEGWTLRGDVAWAKSQWTTALNSYQLATSATGSSAVLQLKIAGVYEKMGQPLRALSAYERVLDQFPEDDVPHVALLRHGQLLIELKQFRRAAEQLTQATRQPQASLESFISLSHAQLLAGQPSDARSTLVRAHECHPDSKVLANLQAKLAAPRDSSVVAN